jgi:hypothetical protein
MEVKACVAVAHASPPHPSTPLLSQMYALLALTVVLCPLAGKSLDENVAQQVCCVVL